MGGRGRASRLPNFQRAIIVSAKLKNYLLHPTKSNWKAAFFQGLGYRMKNFRRMQADIRKGLKQNPAFNRVAKTNKYGHKAYNVEMTLGIDKKSQVVTGWLYDKGDNRPRFITAYPAERGKHD